MSTLQVGSYQVALVIRELNVDERDKGEYRSVLRMSNIGFLGCLVTWLKWFRFLVDFWSLVKLILFAFPVKAFRKPLKKASAAFVSAVIECGSGLYCYENVAFSVLNGKFALKADLLKCNYCDKIWASHLFRNSIQKSSKRNKRMGAPPSQVVPTAVVLSVVKIDLFLSG